MSGAAIVTDWLPTLRFHAHADEAAWQAATARAVADALQVALQQRPRARLLVSGGTTPAPVFRQLSRQAIEWANVDIGLVDERWLPETNPDSNAHLVRQHLLRDAARAARFDGLAHFDDSISMSVMEANRRAQVPADVVLLGMGDDGHTASLFPCMRDLGAALESRNAYVAVDATGCPGAGEWSQRISLTPAGLQPAAARLLLLRGATKRSVLERAADDGDPREYPVRIGFTTPGAILDVHWCA